MITSRYSNAFSEVYEILSYLNEKDYGKIPEDFLSIIEENRNLDYEYELDEELELNEQKMLPETKAILFNIFRDFLSTSEQSKKIKKWQAEDIEKIENQKRQQFDIDIFKDQKENIVYKSESLKIIDKKENIFIKILNKIKKLLKKD